MSYYHRRSRYDSVVIVALIIALVISIIMWAGIIWFVTDLYEAIDSILEVNEKQSEMIKMLVSVNVAQNEYLLGGE